MPETNPVVVVGGGFAGLAVASLLSRRGHRVRLFEASKELGGRARTTRIGEFFLNLGAHALYRGPTEKLFQELGLPIEGSLVSHENALAVGAREITKMPLSAWSLLTMQSLALVDKWRLATTLLGTSQTDLDSVTLGDWLDQKQLEGRSRAMCEALLRVTTYSSASRELSAGFVVDQLRIGRRGVRYLDRGFAQLGEALFKDATAHGASIEKGRAVRNIELSNGRVCAARLQDGERVLASQVVLCVSPAAFAKLVPEDAEARAFAAKAVPMRAACLDVAFTGERPTSTLALGLDEPTFYSLHSIAAKVAPEGAHVAHAVRYLDPGQSLAADDLKRAMKDLLARAAPETLAHAVHEQFLPTMTVSEWTPLASLGGLRGRPHFKSATISGLFRAGDWVGSEFTLCEAASASAMNVVAAIDVECRAGRAA